MRTGTKAGLVKVPKEETKVNSIPNLPQDSKETAVVVDAFPKGELFGTIAEQYKSLLLNDVRAGTQIIHFCCDRYSGLSLKSAEQKRYA